MLNPVRGAMVRHPTRICEISDDHRASIRPIDRRSGGVPAWRLTVERRHWWV
jgi:hypothetical protein